MESKLFRKNSLDHMGSQEDYDEIVQAVRPKVWLILAVLFVLCVAFLIWGFTGTITSTVGVTGYRTGDTLLCAVDPSQGANLKTGMPVEMNGQSVGEVVEVASEPVRKSDLTEKITNEYYLNALVKTDYVILVRIDTAHGALDSATGDLVNVTIVLASYKPIQFLLSSGSAS